MNRIIKNFIVKQVEYLFAPGKDLKAQSIGKLQFSRYCQLHKHKTLQHKNLAPGITLQYDSRSLLKQGRRRFPKQW